jgi:hypothetical protein
MDEDELWRECDVAMAEAEAEAEAQPKCYGVGVLKPGTFTESYGLAVDEACSECGAERSLFLDTSAGVVCSACGYVCPNTLPTVAPGGMTSRKDENDGAANTAMHSTLVHTSGPMHYVEAGGCKVENTRRAKKILGLSTHRRCAHPYRTPIQRSVYADKLILENIYDSYRVRHMRALPSREVMDAVFYSALTLAISLKEEQYEEKVLIEGKKASTNRGSKRFGVLAYCIYMSIIHANRGFITEEEFLSDVVLPAWDGEPCQRSIKGGFAEARLRLNSLNTGNASPLLDLVKVICAKAVDTVIGSTRVMGKHPGFWKVAFMEKCRELAAKVDSVKLSEHKPHAISAAISVLAARELGLDVYTHPLAPVITLDKCCEYLKVSKELVSGHISSIFNLHRGGAEAACLEEKGVDAHPFVSSPPGGAIFVLTVVDKCLGL